MRASSLWHLRFREIYARLVDQIKVSLWCLDYKTIGMTVRYSHLAPKHTLAAVERLHAPTEQPTDTTTYTKPLERVSAELPLLQQVIQ